MRPDFNEILHVLEEHWNSVQPPSVTGDAPMDTANEENPSSVSSMRSQWEAWSSNAAAAANGAQSAQAMMPSNLANQLAANNTSAVSELRRRLDRHGYVANKS